MKKRVCALLLAAVLLCALALPVCASNPAVLSAQAIFVNGAKADCLSYNIGGYNYFRLRDLASLLNGTPSSFSVSYDAGTGCVSLTSGGGYSASSAESDKPASSAEAVRSSQRLVINGKEVSDVFAYNIGGYNYFKLRDLDDELGFDLLYNSAENAVEIVAAEEEMEAIPLADAPRSVSGPVVIENEEMKRIVEAVGTQASRPDWKHMCATVCMTYYDYWKNGVLGSPWDYGGGWAEWSTLGGVMNFPSSSAAVYSMLKQQLDKGSVCILHVQSSIGQHYLLVTGYSGAGTGASDFTACDPADGSIFLLSNSSYWLHADRQVITFA